MGMRGQDMNFYASQRGQDMDQQRLGMQLDQWGVARPWYPIGAAADAYGKFTGFNNGDDDSGSGWDWGNALSGAWGAYDWTRRG